MANFFGGGGSGGSGSPTPPGGVNEDLQFNDAGSFGGIPPGADGEFLASSSGTWAVTTPGLESRTDADGTVALLSTDRAKRVIATHATSSAVSIAQAGTTGFEAGYVVKLLCAIGAGTCTLTPSTSTINGNTTLTLNQGEEATIVSDGTNYSAAVERNFFTLTYLHYGAAATLADTDDVTGIWVAEFPITITKICGRTDTGTSTFNLQKDDGSATSIASSNIIANTASGAGSRLGVCTSAFTAGENILAVGDSLDFLQVTGATSGAPTRITVTISYLRR